MFCDLVESTPLSGKLDLEDVQTLIDAYREACSTAIKRYVIAIDCGQGDL
jgi:class 3 adenylate cyclase